jgi:hypothetical protein
MHLTSSWDRKTAVGSRAVKVKHGVFAFTPALIVKLFSWFWVLPVPSLSLSSEVYLCARIDTSMAEHRKLSLHTAYIDTSISANGTPNAIVTERLSRSPPVTVIMNRCAGSLARSPDCPRRYLHIPTSRGASTQNLCCCVTAADCRHAGTICQPLSGMISAES